MSSAFFHTKNRRKQEIARRVLSCASLLGCLLAVIFLVSASSAFAQLAGNGAISGTVTDPSGAVIPNATITVVAADTNQTTIRQSTSAGDYDVTPLPPGNYKVSVQAPGFETYVQASIAVNALETVSLNVKMTIGAAGQTVTVTALPPNLTTTDAMRSP